MQYFQNACLFSEQTSESQHVLTEAFECTKVLTLNPSPSYSQKETLKFESTDSEFSFSSEVNVESDTDTSDSTSFDSFTDSEFSDSEWSDDSESGNINNNTKSLAVEEKPDNKDCHKHYDLAVLSFSMKHNLAGNAIDDLLKLFSIINRESELPKNYKDLLQNIVHPKIFQHHYCKLCLKLFSFHDPDRYQCITANCGGLRYTGSEQVQLYQSRKAETYFSVVDIRDQFQLILNKNCIWDAILKTKLKLGQSMDQLVLKDITDGKTYKQLSANGAFLDAKGSNISVSFNTDGIPLFSSSGVKLWPVYLTINELPPIRRFSRENVILAGLWQGKGEVPFFSYLTEVGKQLNNLYTDGIDFFPYQSNVKVTAKVCVLFGCVDLQAKAYISNMTMHNGLNGCITCLEPGKSVKQGKGTSRCYPYREEEDAFHLRDTETMKIQAVTASRLRRINGICGPSGLQDWPLFDYVRGLVPDYMHGVLLGVTKTLLSRWLAPSNSKEPYFIGLRVKEISKRLKAITPPDYVERLPRDLEKHYAHLKANELQSWLLHYSLPCLKGILPDLYLEHYSLLSEGIHILLRDNIDGDDLNRARYLLDLFYKKFSNLYGEGSCGLNVHNIGRHLTYYVEHWGPLFGWTCFCFEDFNAQLLNYAHGTGDVTNQIFKRHFAYMHISKRDISASQNENIASFLNKMSDKSSKCVKKTKKTQNCDIVGALCDLPVEQVEKDVGQNFCQYFSVQSIENLKKVLRISVNNQKFYGTSYKKMKKRQCSVALTFSGEIVLVKYFVYNIMENRVFAVCCRFEYDSSPHMFETTGHHIFVMKETQHIHVIPVNELSQKVFLVKVGQNCYISKAPNLFGYSVLK